MLQLPAGFVPGFMPPERPSEPLWYVFAEHRLLVRDDAGTPRLPTGLESPVAGFDPDDMLYMGQWQGRSCLAVPVDAGREPPPGHAYHGLRSLWGRLDDAALGLAGQAWQLLEWDRGNRYCGFCGRPTERRVNERARYCTACRRSHYPRLAPAVMVRIIRDDEILLARSPRFAPGMYSVLAGFVDPGEGVEQAAHREVMEEVGVEIGNLRYFTSQSWPFPHSLMLAFTADYAGGEIRLEDPEIEAADWFRRDNLPGLPNDISIARRLIDDWLLG